MWPYKTLNGDQRTSLYSILTLLPDHDNVFQSQEIWQMVSRKPHKQHSIRI